MSSYFKKYSSILLKLVFQGSFKALPRPQDETACKKWLWRYYLSKATERGNKAAGVIKIRAVFTGSDRHQTPTPDWVRKCGGRQGGEKVERKRGMANLYSLMPMGTECGGEGCEAVMRRVRRRNTGMITGWENMWAGEWKFGKMGRGRRSGWVKLSTKRRHVCKAAQIIWKHKTVFIL